MTKTSTPSGTALIVSALSEVSALAGVPGVSLVFDTYRAGVALKAARRAEQLINAIAVNTGSHDFDAAAQILAAKAGSEELTLLIECGFRDMMDAVDEQAAVCLAVLLAEYVVDGRPPDRRFRRVGRLFRDADVELLPALLAISRAYVAAPAHERTYLVAARDASWVTVAGTQMKELPPGHICASTDVDSAEAIAGLLDASGFARPHSGGWAAVSLEAAELLRLRPGIASTIELLARCLETWEASRPKGQ